MTRIPTVAGTFTSLAAAAVLGACSSEAPAPDPSRAATSPAAASPSTTVASSPAQRTEHGGLAECLTSHGVTDSGGTAIVLGPPAGVDPGSWDSAMKACSGLAPGPGPG